MRRFAFAILLLLAVPAFAGGLVDGFGPDVWHVNANQPATNFGFSATTAGDVDGDGYNDIVIGSPFEDSTLVDEGVAYLYRGSKQGTSLTPSWFYCGRQAGALAGDAVCSAGDVNNDGYADVLVGVPYWNSPANTHVGKVVLFLGSASGLSTTPAMTISSPTAANDEAFGISVAPAGDVNGDGFADVLVGATHPVGLQLIGVAYVFLGNGGGVDATPVWTALGFPVGDPRMGASLSGAGDVNGDGFADIIIGSPGDSRTLANAGAAYVLTGKPSGVMELDTLLVGTAANQRMGQSVSAAGDVDGDNYADIVVGQPGFNANVGRAFIGLGGNKGIKSLTVLSPIEALANDAIGSIVATVGDINGDGYADIGVVARNTGSTSRGRISIYAGSQTGPVYFGEILTRTGTGFFGACVGTSGDTDGDGVSEILVGNEDTYNAPPAEAQVFQFKAPRNGISLSVGGWPRLGPESGSGYGSAVALVNQFDPAEGGKLVIGDPQFGGNGRVSMHVAKFNSQYLNTEQRSFAADGSFQSFGARIADAGDIDGDGYGDFIVSKTTVDNGPNNQVGVVLLQRGAFSALPAMVPFVTGVNPFDRVGSALAGRGDVNGDGFHDVVVGAREWDEPGRADCGKVWVYFGSATGLLTAPPWTLVGSVAEQGFGAGVALTDFDNDGYTDVIVGSSSPTFGSTAPGKVEVFYGGPSGPSNTPGLTYRPPVPEVSYGLTVAAIGDVTADGIADLAVGSPRENNAGVVRIYSGTLGRSQSNDPLVRFEGTQTNGRLGEAIAGGGDLDGDGIGDMAIGEPGWDGGQTDEGRIAIYHGAYLVSSFVQPTYLESNIVGAAYGAAISPFRDINRDGFADLAVGAPGAAGRVYAYYGSVPGRRIALEPFSIGGSGQQTFHPGRSSSPDHLGTRFAYNTAAQGSAYLTPQMEVKPLSQSFDGIPTPLAAPGPFFVDPGSSGNTFANAVLSPELPGRTLKVRGRWTSKNPLFPRSRWVLPEAQTSGDHDIWITGTSVGVPSLSSFTFGISRVAPNPAVGRVESVVSFSQPKAGRVTLDLYDLRGARVRRLLDETRPAGPSSIAWNGRDDDGRTTATGVYFAVLRSGDAVARTKLVRLP